jgi:non-heme chloroperoxidase
VRARRVGLVAGAVIGNSVLARRRWAAAPDPTDGRPLELPDGAERSVSTADGARLAVWEMGDASEPPIVLAHGWTADRRVWASVARDLVGGGRHVVVYDQRGHGRSTLGGDGTTLEALADDLLAVLDDLDAHDAVVVGHSMGGMTAQLFAITHPDAVARRVAAMVLVSTAAAKMSYGPTYQRVATRLARSRTTDRLMRNRTIGPSLVRSTHGRHVSAVALRATLATTVTTPAEVRAGFIGAIGTMDLTAGLPSVRVRTVVVSGSRDTLTLPARSRDIVAGIPGARLEVLRGCGHQVPFEDPHRLAAIIVDAAGPRRPDTTTAGTDATGTDATGTPATSTPATSTPATSTPATSTPATGIPETGIPATSTPRTGGPRVATTSTGG